METLADETNRISYAIGVNIARNLKANFPSVNLSFLRLGLDDVFNDEKLKMPEDYINASIARYNEISTAHVQKKVEDFKTVNLQNAERFLEQNGKKEGVVTLPSGLQYRVLSPGQGSTVKPDATVMAEVHGKTLAGYTVESTLAGERRGPTSIRVSEALPFLKEALSQMSLGTKWELYVHPKLAHGETGSEKVAPNELLIYSIEIVGIQ
jgi:FKBP-type peptidyl-prolyl cis-trans isomerase